MTASWTCPRCERQFGRRNQTHGCAPGMAVDDYYDARPAFERDIFAAVATHLAAVGPLIVEAVDVGVLFKRVRTFAELRPMRGRLRLSLLLSRRLPADPRLVRAVDLGGRRSAYFIDLRHSADIDDDVREWLTEAYLSSPE